MVYNYDHPEEIYPDIIWSPDDRGITKEQEKELESVQTIDVKRDKTELCRACGWNTYNECNSAYIPRIRIFYTSLASGLWQIGAKWMLWDRPNNKRLGNDYMTWQFLHSQGVKNIPLVKEMRQLNEPTDKVQLTLMSRVPGKPLRDVWHTLSPEGIISIRKQLTEALRELRQFTSPVAQRVDGGPITDLIISTCLPSGACKSIGKTTEEWFENMAEELRVGLSKIHRTDDAAVIEEKLQQLKDNFPQGSPYVLTHGDLNTSNIIVDEGRITAIIDWERAGYYPWWAERWWSIRWGHSQSDELLLPLWEDLCPELDEPTFQKTVMDTVNAVNNTYHKCPILHSEQHDRWLRRGFCECKPYGGHLPKEFLGAKLEHKIDYRTDEERRKDDDERHRRRKEYKEHGSLNLSFQDMGRV